MKSRRASDHLSETFTLSPFPPVRQDGSLELPPLARPPVPPPRICEAGPCRNYHTFEIVMDAAKPMAGSIGEGGELDGTPDIAPDHIERQHYCYPNVGIETDLGNNPVISCNRYKPQGLITIGVRRRYRRKLEAWQVQQAALKLADICLADLAESDAREALAEAEVARSQSESPNPDPEGTPPA